MRASQPIEGRRTATVLREAPRVTYRPVRKRRWRLVSAQLTNHRCWASRNSRPAIIRSGAAMTPAACSASRHRKQAEVRVAVPSGYGALGRDLGLRLLRLCQDPQPRPPVRPGHRARSELGRRRRSHLLRSLPSRHGRRRAAAARRTVRPQARPPHPRRADDSPLALELPMTAQTISAACPSTRLRDGKRRLMWSCAVAAIVIGAAAAPNKARAQAFQGTPTLPNPSVAVQGSAARNFTEGSTTETITSGSPTATINWTPYDNDSSGTMIPAGRQRRDVHQRPAAPIRLHRPQPPCPFEDAPVALNGRSSASSRRASATTVGHLWFYSPAGSSSARPRFRRRRIATDPSTQSFQCLGGTFTTPVETTPGSIVVTTARDQRHAREQLCRDDRPRSSGRHRQRQRLRRYVWHAVTMTMNQGLFDIAVAVGTDDANESSTQAPPRAPRAPRGRRQPPHIHGRGAQEQALTMLLSGHGALLRPTAYRSSMADHPLRGVEHRRYRFPASQRLPSVRRRQHRHRPGTYSSNVSGVARGDIIALPTPARRLCRQRHLQHLRRREHRQCSARASFENILTVGGNVTMLTSNPRQLLGSFVSLTQRFVESQETRRSCRPRRG